MTVKRRPVTVTLLAIAVLILAMINIARFWATITNWNTLARLDRVPGPYYIGFTGLLWGAVGLALFWLIWNGHPKARITAFIILGLYVLYFWFDRLVFQYNVPRENTPFTIGLTILVVFYTIFSLSLPANQAFFSRKNEQ
jgi:hypothetical protein